ncbi:hypothetical protein NDU88_004872 [Pleurodeles waltl]|uniref:Uncharacterized protein n=1 Tax=Pleurodeles waltl TaxID=8319 RepID=A0AAV7QFP7_PLEWA|nr:hypothetical protein NDU88_004872 [Pleurodeles waltl]
MAGGPIQEEIGDAGAEMAGMVQALPSCEELTGGTTSLSMGVCERRTAGALRCEANPHYWTLGGERVHRVPTRRPEPGRLPRPILAKLLHYRDRNLLLQTAREKGPLQVVGSRDTFFPDFTLAVQARRATSLEVKWALREEGLRYSLLFPSKLKMMLDGATHSFQEPDEVWTWLESYRAGSTDPKQVECKQPRCCDKRRHTKDFLGDWQVTKPTSQKVHQGKRAALQAAASLMEARSFEDGQRLEPESLNGEDSMDVESMPSVAEGLPHVTPQTSDDIV